MLLTGGALKMSINVNQQKYSFYIILLFDTSKSTNTYIFKLL